MPHFEVYSDESEAVTRRRLADLLLTIADLQRLLPTDQAKVFPPGMIGIVSHPERYTAINPHI